MVRAVAVALPCPVVRVVGAPRRRDRVAMCGHPGRAPRIGGERRAAGDVLRGRGGLPGVVRAMPHRAARGPRGEAGSVHAIEREPGGIDHRHRVDAVVQLRHADDARHERLGARGQAMRRRGRDLHRVRLRGGRDGWRRDDGRDAERHLPHVAVQIHHAAGLAVVRGLGEVRGAAGLGRVASAVAVARERHRRVVRVRGRCCCSLSESWSSTPNTTRNAWWMRPPARGPWRGVRARCG